jgi:hypothetical protein
MKDDHLYVEVTKEVTDGKIDPALWAKAVAKAFGDEEKGKYVYVNLRVEQMRVSSQDIEPPRGDERYMPTGAVIVEDPNREESDAGMDKSFGVTDDDDMMNSNSKSETDSEDGRMIHKLIQGKYGLAKTYWGFAIGISIILYFLSIVIGTLGSPTLSFVWVLGIYSYQVVIWIGTWRSAGYYEGPIIWAGLAKFAVVIGILATFSQLMTTLNAQ